MAFSKALPLFERELECSICTESFVDPRVLSCQHCFCAECIQQLADQTVHGRSVHCPLCRKKTVLPQAGVNSLVKSFLATRILETLVGVKKQHDQDVDHGRIRCDACTSDNESIVAYCSDCFGFICQTCCDAHGPDSAHGKHRVFSLDELRGGKVRLESVIDGTPTCSNADKDGSKCEQASFYCDTCSEAICGSCGMRYHRDAAQHETAPIEEALALKKEKLEELLNWGRKAEKHQAKNFKTLELITQETKETFSKLTTEIERKLAEERSKLDETEEALKRKLLYMQRAIDSALKRQHTTMEDAVSVVTLNNLNDSILRQGSEQDLFATFNEIVDNYAQIRDVQDYDIRYVLHRLSAFLSGLQFQSRVDCGPIGSIVFSSDWMMWQALISNHGDRPSRITAFPDGSFALGYTTQLGSVVRVFDKDGKAGRDLGTTAVSSFSAISDGSVVVFDVFGNVSIHIASTNPPSQRVLISSDAIVCDTGPLFLTTDAAENIILVYEDRVCKYEMDDNIPTSVVPIQLASSMGSYEAMPTILAYRERDETSYTLMKVGSNVRLLQQCNNVGGDECTAEIPLPSDDHPANESYGTMDDEGGVFVAQCNHRTSSVSVYRYDIHRRVREEVASDVHIDLHQHDEDVDDILLAIRDPSQLTMYAHGQLFIFKRSQDSIFQRYGDSIEDLLKGIGLD